MRVILIGLAISSLLACDKKEGADQKPPEAAGAATTPSTAPVTAGGQAVDQAVAAAGGAADNAAEVGATAAQEAAEAGAAAAQAGAAAVAAGEQAVDQAAVAASGAATKAAEAGAAAAQAGAAAAESAAGAAATVSAAVASAATPPADFPVPVPAGVKGTFTDRTSSGRRSRSAIFTYSGSGEELATQYEQSMKAKGLEPEVKKTTLGQSQIVSIRAKKGDLEAKALITTAKSGTSQVTVIWREPAQ